MKERRAEELIVQDEMMKRIPDEPTQLIRVPSVSPTTSPRKKSACTNIYFKLITSITSEFRTLEPFLVREITCIFLS